MLVAFSAEDDGDFGARLTHGAQPYREAPFGLLGLDSPPQQMPDGVRYGQSFVAYTVHSIGQRHLHVVALGQCAHRCARLDAFGDLTVRCFLGALERTARTETFTEGTVS